MTVGTDEKSDILERRAVTLRISGAGAVRLGVVPASGEPGGDLLTGCLEVGCRHRRQCAVYQADDHDDEDDGRRRPRGEARERVVASLTSGSCRSDHLRASAHRPYAERPR